MGQWMFARQRGDDDRSEAKEEMLFQTEQAGEGDYAGSDSLVREILQNALDARADQEQVRLRFSLHEADEAPPRERLSQYFARLQAPLAKRQIDCDEHGVPQLPCRFLVVEDFGTRGLEGDPQRNRDPEGDDQQAFYWFWRNNWRSAKTGEKLGRHGLGKTVFRAASRVGCMWGLTIRKSDRRRLLMGKAVLHLHEYENQEYKANGHWCSGQNADGLAQAIEDHAELAKFSREWKLSRADEPGLSVVSPFVPEELNAERLAQAVAIHFFLPILRGQLEVEVIGRKTGHVVLDQERLASVCQAMAWNGPARSKRHAQPPLEFARRCIAAKPDVETPVLGQQRIPVWSDPIFAEEQLVTLRKKLADGERVGVRVRVHLPMKKEPAKEGAFDVWLQRAAMDKRCDGYFIREGMTITKISSMACKRGYFGLVVVEKGPLAAMLGDTEGPSHEDWGTVEDRANGIWKTWKGRKDFVKKSLDGLVELLTVNSTAANYELLSDFFSIESPRGRQSNRKSGDDVPGAPQLDIPQVAPKWYQIAPRAGGFAVRRDRKVAMPANTALRVAVAYDIPQGDPIRKWNPLDFVIGVEQGTLKPEERGLMAVPQQGNIVELRDIADDFEFCVEGFDPHRDLFVRVDEIAEQELADS